MVYLTIKKKNIPMTQTEPHFLIGNLDMGIFFKEVGFLEHFLIFLLLGLQPNHLIYLNFPFFVSLLSLNRTSV